MAIGSTEQLMLPYLRDAAWWATLENGQQVFAIPKPGEVVHLHTVVRTGSINETAANTGVSHFLEHLMFKGTERFPVGVFDRLLEGIGGRVNAGTSKDFTQYHITLPKGITGEHYRLALDLHADMLLHAALPDEEIGPSFDLTAPPPSEKRERMVIMEEIKMGKDNPWRLAMQTLTESLYPTHPYRREVIGTAEVIATIPRESLLEYYRTWYQPANMVTIITGDLDPQETIRDVARHFEFQHALPVTHPEYAAEIPPVTPRVTQLAMPLNVAYVILGFLGPSSSDLRAEVALDALSLILGEGRSSRLQLRLVEQLPNTPIIEAGSTHWSYRDSGNVLGFAIARPDAAKQTYDLLREQVQKLHTEPPTSEEIEKTVTRLEASFAAQAETSVGLSSSIADSMARLNNPSHYTEYLPVLRSLTRDELAHYAATYLAEESICAVTVSPSGKE